MHLSPLRFDALRFLRPRRRGIASVNAEVRDGIVANYAAAYLEILFSYPQLRDVLAWGMCDRFTWLNGFTPRKDGTRQRATPYDAEYRPKALYGVIRDAFAGAVAR